MSRPLSPHSRLSLLSEEGTLEVSSQSIERGGLIPKCREIQRIFEPGKVIVKTLLTIANPLQTYNGCFVLRGTKTRTCRLFNVTVFIVYAFLSPDPGRRSACCCSTSLLTRLLRLARWIIIPASAISQLVPLLKGLLTEELLQNAVSATWTVSRSTNE